MTFSEILLDMRKKNGLSQEDLANQIGVSRQTVSKWESGQSYPEAEKLMLLSEQFSVSVDYLLKGETEKSSPEVPDQKESRMPADTVEKEVPAVQKVERTKHLSAALFLIACIGNFAIYQASRYIKVQVPKVDHHGVHHWDGFKSIDYFAFLDKYYLEPVVLLLTVLMLWTGKNLLCGLQEKKKGAKEKRKIK